MNDRLKWKEKLAKRLFDSLNESLVLVEGARDERALREIGVSSKIFHAVGSPSKLVERILGCPGSRARRVVLLLDYDQEGERKARFFSEVLAGEGLRVDLDSRRLLRRLLGVRIVEEIPGAWRELIEEIERGKRARRQR